LVGLLSALLGACLALAALYAVNGTLDFHTAAVRVVQTEVVRLENEVGALNARLGDVERGLQSIQALDSRLTEVETDVEQLTAGLDQITSDLDRLSGELDQLAGDLDATQDQVTSMAETMDALRQEFTNLSEDLGGLADHVSMLANRTKNVEEQLAGLNQRIETVQQAAERFDAFLDGLRGLLIGTGGMDRGTSPLGSSAEQTPTLRPQVTVIPLATPTPEP
jgi:chromosome segregation ATPase